jgi:hypothetical protein
MPVGAREEAARMLAAYTEKVVNDHQTKKLSEAMEAAKKSVEHSPRNFSGGVLEAIVGAALWTVLLIIISILVQRDGIDLLEDYRRLAGK